MKKILGGGAINYVNGPPPWLVDEESFSFKIV